MIPTRVHYVDKMSDIHFSGKVVIVIYDKNLLKISAAKKWITKQKISYGVRAGEGLKDIDSFAKHIKKIFQLTGSFSAKEMVFVSVGGGSVNDFVGFVASVFKRGVKLVHIPTTYLAAIDSSHGGKNALNVGMAKNQLGTIYLPESVYIIKQVLKAQPVERLNDALGELFKMALLHGGALAPKVLMKKKWSFDDFWALIPMAVQAKYDIVSKDLNEKLGLRYTLNLGHTIGHVLELRFKLGHGTSVFFGTLAALSLSQKRGFLKPRSYEFIMRSPFLAGVSTKLKAKMKEKEALAALAQDKKQQSSGKIIYVFLKDVGEPHLEELTIDEILQEMKEQGWVRV